VWLHPNGAIGPFDDSTTHAEELRIKVGPASLMGGGTIISGGSHHQQAIIVHIIITTIIIIIPALRTPCSRACGQPSRCDSGRR
jgi:hypothetical protein